MVIVLTSDVFLAHIAHHATALRADHLVAAILLDDIDAAFGTLANQRLTHRLFNKMTIRYSLFPPRLVTRHRNMALQLAQSTANDLAVQVAADEFSVFLHRRADRFEFAERTLFEAIKIGLRDFILLLKGIEFIQYAPAYCLLQVDSAEASIATAGIEAC